MALSATALYTTKPVAQQAAQRLLLICSGDRVLPDHTHHAFLAAALAQMGDKTAAAAHAQEAMRLDAGFSAEGYLATLHYRQDRGREHHREALLKAGLPE